MDCMDRFIDQQEAEVRNSWFAKSGTNSGMNRFHAEMKKIHQMRMDAMKIRFNANQSNRRGEFMAKGNNADVAAQMFPFSGD